MLIYVSCNCLIIVAWNTLLCAHLGEMIGDSYKLLRYNVKGKVIGNYHGDAEPNNNSAHVLCMAMCPKTCSIIVFVG